MRWFRSNVQCGSWCALLALAIQLTLSFGHVHRAGGVWPSGFLPLAALAADRSSDAVPDAAPGAPKPAGLAFDFCTICTVINLVGTMLPAGAPALSLPVGSSGVQHRADIDFVQAPLRHLMFEARAPPQA